MSSCSSFTFHFSLLIIMKNTFRTFYKMVVTYVRHSHGKFSGMGEWESWEEKKWNGRKTRKIQLIVWKCVHKVNFVCSQQNTGKKRKKKQKRKWTTCLAWIWICDCVCVCARIIYLRLCACTVENRTSPVTIALILFFFFFADWLALAHTLTTHYLLTHTTSFYIQKKKK